MKLSRRGLLRGTAAFGSLWAVGCSSTRGREGAEVSRASASSGGKRILILGGTGFLGPQLVEAARSRGHTVTLFNRGKTRPQLFPDVEKLHGDRAPKQGEGLKALEGRSWDAVIDTSGYVPRIVRDLAEWALLTIDNRDFGTFNATGPAKPLTMRDMLEACNQASGGNATFTWADAAFLEQQKVRPWMDMPVWVPAEGEMAGMSSVSNARAVARGLKFRPTVDTARDTLAWFNGLPPERQAELRKRAGLSPEREREVLAVWHQQRAGVASTP